MSPLIVILMLAAGPLEPEPPIARDAKRHLDLGLERFTAKDYAAAIIEFKVGYGLDPRRDFLYAIAQAHRLSGSCKDAVPYYELFLKTSPAERQAEPARQNLERCQAAMVPAITEDHPPPKIEPRPPPRIEPPLIVQPATPQPEPTPAWYQDTVGDLLDAGGVISAGAGLLLWRSGRSAIEAQNGAATYGAFGSAADPASGAAAKEKLGVGLIGAGVLLLTAGILHAALSD